MDPVRIKSATKETTDKMRRRVRSTRQPVIFAIVINFDVLKVQQRPRANVITNMDGGCRTNDEWNEWKNCWEPHKMGKRII
uniref:Uncharacterized protein n=1 Tax=Angiostrongylus cantonensis TaxID=6313 RepID=A0A0K0DH35_ANGCA